MTHTILTDPTAEPTPTHKQRRLALTAAGSLRTVATQSMDIGPDLDDPIGRVRHEAYTALMEGREFVSVRDVIAWAHETFQDVA